MEIKDSSLKLLYNSLSKNSWIDIPSTGCSMHPLISSGDICRFVTFTADELKVGDIVLFITDDEHLIGHRIIHIVPKAQSILYICKGDANIRPDAAARAEQIIGKLEHIIKNKNKKRYHVNTTFLKLWGWLVIKFPLISRMSHWHARRKKSNLNE